MANASEIISIVLAKILNKDGYPFDNIFTKVPLIQYLVIKDKKEGNTLGTNNRVKKLDGGEPIEMPIEYATLGGAQFFDGLDVINYSTKDTITNATYPWRNLVNPLLIDNKDILKCQGSSAKITDLVGSKLRNMNKSIASTMNSSMLAVSPGAKDFLSVPQIVAKVPTSGTIGNINRATAGNEFWRNKTKQSAATTYELLVREIDNLRNTISYNRAGDAPDLMLTDQIVYEYVIAYMRSKGTHTFQNDEMSNVLGVDVAKARGMNIIWDNDVPILDSSKSTIYLLNTDYLFFCVQKDRQFKLEGPEDLIFSRGQDAKAWAVFLMGNLVTSSPFKQGVIWNVAQNIAA